jgi:hypothetical protein
VDKALAYEVQRMIKLLIGDDEEEFSFQKEIALVRLQTFILFPDRAEKMLKTATLLSCARFLQSLESSGRKKVAKDTTPFELLNRTLSRERNSRLYDACFGPDMGWWALAREPSQQAFRKRVEKRRSKLKTVVSLIDYRFRYLDHQQGNPKNANITHSHVYVWLSRGMKGRDRIIADWNLTKITAPFIYVTQKWGTIFRYPRLGERDFIKTLKRNVSNRDELRRELGMFAYVADKLISAEPNAPFVGCIPSANELPRVQPSTAPLPVDEIKSFLDRYPGRDGLAERFHDS